MATSTGNFNYAAFDALSVGSGAGPHTYVEKIGVGSSRDPLDMMMPSGSSDRFVSEFFVILDTSVMRSSKAQQGPSWRTDRRDVQIVLLQYFRLSAVTRANGESIRIDTKIINTCVELTQAFMIS